MDEIETGDEHWWLRWGYKAFWALVVLGIGSCSVLTPPKQLVVDRNGVPNSWWSRIELSVQGRAFYEAQLQAVGYEIQKQERDIDQRRDRSDRQEEIRAQFEAAMPREQVKDPYFSEANRLEQQAEQLRDLGVRNMLEKIDTQRLEDLRLTEKSLIHLLHGF